MERQRFEVRSSKDGGVAFTAETVELEARAWRVSLRKAAKRIAEENADSVMGETLTIHRIKRGGARS